MSDVVVVDASLALKWILREPDSDIAKTLLKRGNAHINTAEGVFSQLKRSIDGTHHHVSAYHLHRYVSEFDYRYNTRKIDDSDRTITAIQKTTGKWLMYQKPL